jgi:lipid A 3-O-deacylase
LLPDGAGCYVALLMREMVRFPLGIVVAVLAMWCAAAPPAFAQFVGDEPSYLDLGAGAFDAFGFSFQGDREASTTWEARAEYRYGRKFLNLGPALGVVANGRGGWMAYAGIYTDFRLGSFVLTPLGGIGAYHKGASEDLGGVFQFRLSATAAYEFSNASRLGIQVAHISNAGIHPSNPGENELLLTYAIPLDWLR